MDQKLVDTFSKSYSASMRSVKIQLCWAVLLAAFAVDYFLKNQVWAAGIDAVVSLTVIFFALRLRWAAQRLRPLIDGTAEQ
jgi:hypothetical protein